MRNFKKVMYCLIAVATLPAAPLRCALCENLCELCGYSFKPDLYMITSIQK